MVMHATVVMPVPAVKALAPPNHSQSTHITGEHMTLLYDTIIARVHTCSYYASMLVLMF